MNVSLKSRVRAALLLAITKISSPAFSQPVTPMVTTIGHWSIECDTTPTCYAVGVLPDRKVRMKGANAALQIEFTNPLGLRHGITLLKLDGPESIEEIKLNPVQADELLTQLQAEKSFLIWVPISETQLYYVPGLGFGALISHVQRVIPDYQYPLRTIAPSGTPHL